MLQPDAENRKNKNDGYHGEGHPGNGADGEVKPEDFFRAVGEEWEEAKDS